MMKNVAIIGASGYVGSVLLQEALGRNLHVKAIVRHPEKIPLHDNHLEVVKGDVSHPAEVRKLVEGMDAVISSYNPGWKIRIFIRIH